MSNLFVNVLNQLSNLFMLSTFHRVWKRTESKSVALRSNEHSSWKRRYRVIPLDWLLDLRSRNSNEPIISYCITNPIKPSNKNKFSYSISVCTTNSIFLQQNPFSAFAQSLRTLFPSCVMLVLDLECHHGIFLVA